MAVEAPVDLVGTFQEVEPGFRDGVAAAESVVGIGQFFHLRQVRSTARVSARISARSARSVVAVRTPTSAGWAKSERRTVAAVALNAGVVPLD